MFQRLSEIAEVASLNKDERRESARKMKEDGMSATLIAKYTGFSVEEIAKL